MKKYLLGLLILAGHIAYGQVNIDSLKLSLKFPTAEDFQKYPVSPSAPIHVETNVPPAIDLSTYGPPAQWQGYWQGSCSAFAIAYSRTFQENIKRGRNHSNLTFDASSTFSPAFIFNIFKTQYSPCEGKTGMFLSEGLDILKTVGCCFWNIMPYDVSLESACVYPKPFAFQNAADFKLISPQRLPIKTVGDIYQFKYILSKNLPVMISLSIDSTFVNEGNTAGRAHGKFIWSNPNVNKLIGNHSMLVVGYNDTTGTFKVLNSWGIGWGLDGCVEIPYNVFLERVYDAFYSRELAISTQYAFNNQNTTIISPAAANVPPEGTAFLVGDKLQLDEIEAQVAFIRSDNKLITVNIIDNQTNKLIYVIDCQLHASKLIFYNNKTYKFSFNNAEAIAADNRKTKLFINLTQNASFENAFQQIESKAISLKDQTIKALDGKSDGML